MPSTKRIMDAIRRLSARDRRIDIKQFRPPDLQARGYAENLATEDGGPDSRLIPKRIVFIRIGE
jgi:hypothetical protein